MVDLEAGAKNIVGLTSAELPSLKQEMKSGWPMLIPLFILISLLAYSGSTPSKAAFWSIMAIVIIAFLSGKGKFGAKELLESLETGGKGVIEVAAACATAGVIIGVITLTGLGMKLSSVLIFLANDNTFILLLLTAGASIVLGMGVPTTACYLIVAMLVAPALIKMDILPIAAHLFVFYYGVMSMITPPVALAAYAAAGIAESDPFRTGFAAMRLGVVAFVIPFMFVYSPALLLEGTFSDVIRSVITAILGTVMLSVGLHGWLKVKIPAIARAFLILAGLLLIDSGVVTDIMSIGFLAAAFFITKFCRKINKGNIEEIKKE
jgi:TRAP transporter 4TM/12TM fusion protein